MKSVLIQSWTISRKYLQSVNFPLAMSQMTAMKKSWFVPKKTCSTRNNVFTHCGISLISLNTLERVSTRVVVRSPPKHLPVHAEVTSEGSSSDKLYKSVFCGITGQVVVMLVKLTTKTHSPAAGYFSQLHRYGPPFWSRMKSIGFHREAINSNKI